MMEHFETLTLERLMKHCVPRGACLEWVGHCNGTQPQMKLGGVGGQAYGLRRAIYLLTRGEGSIRKGFQVGIKASCTCATCVHPDHLMARSKSIAQRGIKVKTKTRLRIAATKRAQSSTLDMEKVREIRARDEPCSDLDAIYGLTPGYAWKIKTNKRWVDHASPFAGLMR